MNSWEKFSSFFIFVTLIVAVTSTIWTDYRLMLQEESYGTGAPKCIAPGLMCHGCKEVYFCDDNNRPAKTQNCNSTQNCENGKCTNTVTFQCSPAGSIDFQCEMEGLFPDPGDCFKYHICVADTDRIEEIISNHERTCKNQYSFNPRTGFCDRKMTNHTCPSYPVPLCSAPAQTGALKDNPSIYYMCQVYEDEEEEELIEEEEEEEEEVAVKEKEDILYPYLRICENGKQYDPLKYSCK